MVRLLCGVSLREVVELVDVAMANYKNKVAVGGSTG